ncbi:NAD(P)H-hydrate dehydratase [Leisingera sp. S232]|uniref:NAD(P)H-hydrate dehydratase n=1 Tax=Leisingera sp. S232 TaxID=3415132 RepID=UPI003C7C0310
MTELLTAAQMRAIEQAAIESGEVTGLELMERAGQGVVEAIFEEWPELAESVDIGRGASPSRSPEYLEKDEGTRRAVVLCGPGNNGGDGFVVARLLKERGWEVEVFLYGDPDKLPPDAKVNYERWLETGKLTDNSLMRRDYLCQNFELRIDAVFGSGLSRPLEGDAWAFCWEMIKSTPEVAIDVPSGFCSDSGRFLDSQDKDWSDAPDTQLIVTFQRPRQGHYLAGLAAATDKVVVKDIGLGAKVPSFKRNATGRGDSSITSLMTARIRSADTKRSSDFRTGKQKHKYSHGHALVLSGGHGKTGAARLAARGALRIGAGLVTVGSPRSAMFENAVNLTAIMLQQIDGAHGVSEMLEDTRFNAICLGPGLGRGADTQAVVMAVLKEQRATVLDADALTRFERKPEALFNLLHETCVITPHGGEFAKLFPDLAEKLNAPATAGPAYSKVDATREAAKRAGCVVLFKGPDTVIAAPDGRCSVNSAHYERSAPWLATAGSGDVLAGFITGLMARGFSPMQAAETAAYIHVECALEFGPGLIAEDLPEQIPAVFRKLGL